jgi:hypothetical protein
MIGLKRGFVAALGLATLMFGTPSWSSTAGTPVFFNFTSPVAGPFVSLSLNFGIDRCTVFESDTAFGCNGVASPDDGTITLFDGLNGSGSSLPIGSWDDFTFSTALGTATSSLPGTADGVFSLLYAASVGNISAAPFVDLTDGMGVTTRFVGVGIADVPEPGSVALLTIGGVAALSASRRRDRAT